MRKFLNALSACFSTYMEIVAGLTLIGIMLLIGADILGRALGHPVPGAYEIVSLAGGLIVGLALPATSMANGHISTDILLAKLHTGPKLFLAIITRFIGIVVFLLAGYGMVMMGVRLKASGEVTAVLAFPFYHVAYAIGGAFAIQAIVLLAGILNPAPEPPEGESRYE